MKELNYKTLRESLDQLPEYEAPAAIWSTLETALETEEKIATDLPKLPVYTPPPALWNRIEAELENLPAENTPQRGKSIRFSPAFLPYSIAAAMALLLATWWFWKPAGAPAAGVTIAISLEVVDDQLLNANRESEDKAFALVQELCRNPSTGACTEPEFQTLKNELDELTSAKAALKDALGEFGDDPELHAQLARIERERSDLLRQMMAMI